MTQLPRFGRLIVLACMGLAVACTSGTDSGTAGNTQLNLDIVNPGGDTGELFSIDRVDYRITCAGNLPGSYPIPDADTSGTDYAYDDAVDISGAFETVDTRNPPVWQAVMDLPPGDCTITLSVYEDDEIVCVGSQTLLIEEDETTKYDIVLVCSLSIDTPDGMADVDGTFEFITGNVCPKLYVLNAIPSGQPPTVGNEDGTPIPQDPITGVAATEIQYRAKDPDDTCGNNCDPQSCDFSNPPVCTPYASNSNDPNCNLAAGGDPSSAACLAGDFAGLVCTIAAFPSASNPGFPFAPIATPGGTFISPADGITPVGPVLPVNLNLAAGIPGITLPGLGGPAGSNAANSPAYPPLPNVNGSLPPLVYQCDILQPGATFVLVHCSDGDAECDQAKAVVLQCPGNNFCISDPIDCSATAECLTDGVCDANCDPLDPGCTDRCPGQDLDGPDGAPCSIGQCLAGACVECVDDSACTDSPATPVDCQLANTCVGNSCTAGGIAPAGTPCSNGECDGVGIGASACLFVPVDPPLQSANLDMGCTNNVTADISILPYVLDVDPDVILETTATTAEFSGVAEFSETFLDAAQGAVPGGVTQADLIALAATVQIRTGGTLSGAVALTNAPIPTFCLIGGAACDPVNDGASVPGAQPNTDCVPTGTFNPCQANVSLPTSSDCTVGGVCDLIGKKVSQCDLNGFCVTGGLPLDLEPQTAGFTPAASGIVNFGYADEGTGSKVCVGGTEDGLSCNISPTACTDGGGTCASTNVPTNVDGTYALPAAVFTASPALNEIKVNASGLSVALVCTMAVDSGGPDGVGVPDQASPTPTANLNTFNIQVPTP